jgi:exodeoxyribonuclease V gamma subunit
MADDPLPGDRSRREDDRYLFLEAILSARRVLYVSYTGFDVRDNGERQPSVLVADLVGYVTNGFGVDPVRRHPLQPFDARYFGDDARLFSYAEELCRARRVQGARVETESVFVAGPIAEPDEAWRTIAIDDLVHFFRNPSRHFLRDRLGLRLEAARGEVETREPFVLDALERYKLCEEAVRLRRAGIAAKDLAGLLRAAGCCRTGGGRRRSPSRWRSSSLVQRLETFMPSGAAPSVTIDLELEGFRVRGALVPSRDGGFVDSGRPAKLAIAFAGIRHLALAAGSDGGESRWLGTSETVILRPVAGARDHLADLVGLYRHGLRGPLPFFPRAAYAACEAKKDPLKAARKACEPSTAPDAFGDGDDPYNALAFRGRDPFDDDFLALARRIFDPLRAHQVEEDA